MHTKDCVPSLPLASYPYLQFPATWEVSIIPPWPLAELRFLVRKRGSKQKGVSVYFYAKDQLGCVWQPYWALYPYCDGDTRRFFLGEEAQLLCALRYALASNCSI